MYGTIASPYYRHIYLAFHSSSNLRAHHFSYSTLSEKPVAAPFKIQTENYPTIGFQPPNDLKLLSVSKGAEFHLSSDIYKSGSQVLSEDEKKVVRPFPSLQKMLLSISPVKTQTPSSINGSLLHHSEHFLFGFTTKLLSKMFYGSK